MPPSFSGLQEKLLELHQEMLRMLKNKTDFLSLCCVVIEQRNLIFELLYVLSIIRNEKGLF